MHLVCDSAAGLLMLDKKVDIVFVGADRAVHNGDVANKIGTYKLAVLVRCVHHPPSSTCFICGAKLHLLICRRKSTAFRFTCVCPLPPLT
jgi:translation initiation factor 2B subunit (eIF-2B alpha/beta/delta family)